MFFVQYFAVKLKKAIDKKPPNPFAWLQLLAAPAAASGWVVRRAARALAPLAKDREDLRPALLDLCVAIGDAVQLHAILNNLGTNVPDHVKIRLPEINRLRRKLVSSRSGLQRRQGYELWITMLDRGLTATPALEPVIAVLQKEDDMVVQGLLAAMVADVAAQGDDALQKGVATLEQLAERTPSEYVRERALLALLRAIIRAPDGVDQLEDKLFKALLTPPLRADRLTVLRELVAVLVPVRCQLARRLLAKFINTPELLQIGSSAKRDVIAGLRSPVRELFQVLPRQEIKVLLAIVPRLDRFFGRMLVDAACTRALLRSRASLEAILSDSRTPPDIHKLILDHLHVKERTTGSRRWPALYDALDNGSQSS